jgi:hypothetical protein
MSYLEWRVAGMLAGEGYGDQSGQRAGAFERRSWRIR